MPNKQQKRERDRQDVVLFFELIQIAIGNRAHLSFPPNNIQWNNTFTIASQQSLIGITFVGLNKIPKSQMPNELLILKWFGMTELLVKRNKILNLQTTIYQMLKGLSIKDMKFLCIVLKIVFGVEKELTKLI